jgi:hypothetical protein
MDKINPKELKIHQEEKNFIFSIIGLKTINYKGEYNTIEFPEPMKGKDGVISLFNPISLQVLKKKLVSGLNKKLEKKIKGIISFKVKIVGSGEEKWI